MSAPADPETVALWRRRVAADPADAAALYALGTALWWSGLREEAAAHLARAVALQPDNADARTNLGNALTGLGRPAEAMPHLAAAAALRPDHAPSQYNLGNALLAAGQAAEAAAQFRTALDLMPGHAGAHNNLGNALRALGRVEEALASYRCAVELRADLAGAHNNMGSALLALHRPAEALPALLEALRLNPDYAEACNNLGGALLALDRPEEAIVQFRRAVGLDASQVQAEFGESLALLTLGRYREGWEGYESRWRDPRFCEDERAYPMPRWHDAAADIGGRTVLLHAEQGLGDTIQFVRYAPLVRRLGAQVVLEVQAPLLGLVQTFADRVIPAGADLPPCDFHCPLLSLPLAFRTDVPTIPAQIPYLRADPARRAAWAERLGPRRRMRVGLAISGSAEHPEDALRSIPAALFAPLLALPDVDFHLVQKDVREPDMAVLRAAGRVTLHADHLRDFTETAALLGLLDLLVSVDTSAAHLGGALGMPVWLLLQSNADFRWLRVREDSPWYPSMRLFRQSAPRRWEPVLARVAAALRERIAQRG
jgi:tetratricopeptide (TPR) repeat protein